MYHKLPYNLFFTMCCYVFINVMFRQRTMIMIRVHTRMRENAAAVVNKTSA